MEFIVEVEDLCRNTFKMAGDLIFLFVLFPFSEYFSLNFDTVALRCP